MDGILTNALHGNLHRLSELNLRALIHYYESGFLSSQDRSSLLKDLTSQEDTLQVQASQS